MTEMRVVLYNLDNYDPLSFTSKNPASEITDDKRHALIPQVISDLEPDVVLLQQLCGQNDKQVGLSLRMLAAEADLQCTTGKATTAAKSRQQYLGTGVLWGGRFTPSNFIPRTDFWHPISTIEGSVGGSQVALASYDAQSPDKVQKNGDLREPEAYRLGAYAERYGLTLIGGNFGSLSTARWQNGEYVDPDPDLKPAVRARLEPFKKDYLFSRKPGAALERGGLLDVVANLALTQNTVPDATTDNWLATETAARPERAYALPSMASMVTAVEVVKNDQTAVASSHYPVVMTIQLE